MVEVAPAGNVRQCVEEVTTQNEQPINETQFNYCKVRIIDF